ncbi:MAG: hypothetical protein MJZ74_10420 [Muribaculaceae bacterium]|nr:hypothetical protein [Muribaculaceae bacterium]
MRKVLLVSALAMLFSSCGLMGDIAMDSTSMDGVRTVLTTNKRFMNETDVALGVRINKKDTVAGLLLTSEKNACRGIFGKGDRLKVDFADGSSITLKNIYDKEYEKETTQSESERIVDAQVGYNYIYSPYTDAVYITPNYVTAIVPERHTYTTTLSYALYPITYSQLVDMMTKSAVKVSVESDNGVDKMDNPAKLGEIIGGVYGKLVRHAAKNP